MDRDAPAEQEHRAYVEELYVHYLPIMEKAAKRYLVDKSEAEDVINDCAEKLVRLVGGSPVQREGYEDSTAAFLIFMVRNRCYDYNRRLQRERKYISQVTLEELSLPDGGPAPEEFAISREWFYDALMKLSLNDQRLILGKYVFGASDEELAQTLGCKTVSVRVKLMRARERIKKLTGGVHYETE